MTANIGSIPIAQGALDFLWLELTSRCNMRCIHCYAEAEPGPASRDILKLHDYQQIIRAAVGLGCKNIQFIGGEPTLFSDLKELINLSHELGYQYIEVFTNAIRISDELLECLVINQVHVATSFYSHKAAVHDKITNKPGSHAHTIKTISKLLASGLQIRAGIIAMPENADHVEETKAFLNSLGVHNVGSDRVRGIGRGGTLAPRNKEPDIKELCGSCWKGSVCVSSDGTVSPCIMSKKWNIGSVLKTDFCDIVRSDALHDMRKRIYDEVWSPGNDRNGSVHITGDDCSPCYPTCTPRCSPNCNPVSCGPRMQCDPKLFCGPCYPQM